MLSKVASCTIFWVFGMTRPGIEPRSPGQLVNTLTTIRRGQYRADTKNTFNKYLIFLLGCLIIMLNKQHLYIPWFLSWIKGIFKKFPSSFFFAKVIVIFFFFWFYRLFNRFADSLAQQSELTIFSWIRGIFLTN